MITYNLSIKPESERQIYTDMEFTSGDINAYTLIFEGINTTGKTLTLKALRADGAVVVASSQTNSIVLPQSMYSIPGEVSFELAVYDGLGSCSTLCVIYACVREGFGDGEAAETDKFPILKDILNRLQAIENK